MANNIDTSTLLTGSSGDVWFDGALLATVKTIKCSVKGDFTQENFVGSAKTYNVFQGWSGDGSMSWDKIDSSILTKAANSYKSGTMPNLKIITSLTNVDGQTEKYSIEGVNFTGFDLANIEAKKILEESFSFSFDDYEILDTIS